MTINVPNPEALKAGFANIQANLVYWDQRAWVQVGLFDEVPPANTCGTTACLAGHIVLASGVSWKELMGIDVAETAMKLLGYTWYEDEDGETVYDGDGNEFNDIFYRMYSNQHDLPLEYDQQAFDDFKAEVSTLTGVEL